MIKGDSNRARAGPPMAEMEAEAYTSPSDSSNESSRRAPNSDAVRVVAYRTTPRSACACNVASRAVIAVLALLSLILVCVSFGATLAQVNFPKNSKGSGVYLDIRMWQVSSGLVYAKNRPGLRVFYDERMWMNTVGRIFAIISFVFALVSLVLAIVFVGLRGCHESSRARDDEEQHMAMDRDQRTRRERESADSNGLNRRVVYEFEPATGLYVSDADRRRSFPSTLRKAAHYHQREEERRSSDYRLGAALFSFLLLTAVACLVTLVSCGVFLQPGSLADALDDNFATSRIDDDLVEDYGIVSLQGGFWVLLIALLASLIGLIVLAVCPISGLMLCGPRPVDRSGGDFTDIKAQYYHSTRDGAIQSPMRSSGADVEMRPMQQQQQQQQQPMFLNAAPPMPMQQQQQQQMWAGVGMVRDESGPYNNSNNKKGVGSSGVDGAAKGSSAAATSGRPSDVAQPSPPPPLYSGSGSGRPQAMRGIPVALPGPPMEEIDHAAHYSEGDGAAQAQYYTSEAAHMPRTVHQHVGGSPTEWRGEAGKDAAGGKNV